MDRIRSERVCAWNVSRTIVSAVVDIAAVEIGVAAASSFSAWWCWPTATG